jgi:hypothetical protein
MVDCQRLLQSRDERRTIRLMPAVANRLTKIAGISRLQRAQEHQGPLQVEDCVLQWHRRGQNRARTGRL